MGISKDLAISREVNKITIAHNKEEIDTIALIGEVLKYLEIKDIEIVDMPVSEIIKRIYKEN